MRKPSQKLVAVRNVKEKLSQVKVLDVAEEMQCTRQNIYKHLNEDNAESVNLETLKKISDAIDTVLKRMKSDEAKTLNSIIKS
jgi:DNA-binding Xre family transcriptional regulator